MKALLPVLCDFFYLGSHSRLSCSFLSSHYMGNVMPDNKVLSGALNARLFLEMDPRLH